MKNFFKKAKKSMTLGVAKVKSGVSSDAKKKENEDPQFIEQTEKLRSLKAECMKVIKALNSLGKEIEALTTSLELTGNTFNDVIKPDCNPYYQFSSKSQECLHEYDTYMHNFSSYYLKNVLMKPLNDMDAELDNLNIIREKRKKNKILLQQEEKHLKSAQEKNKEVDYHIEKTRLRREKYERYNAQFLTGVATIYDRRPYIFGQAFDIYQFYLAELVELQERCIKQNLAAFPMDSLRTQIQSCSSKPQLNLASPQNSSFGVAQSSPYNSQSSMNSSTFSQQYQSVPPPQYNQIQTPQQQPQITTQTPTPAVQIPAPTVQTPAPSFQKPAPAVQTPTPAVQKPTPAAQTPMPSVQIPAPAVRIPGPAAQTPGPAAQTPGPAVQIPAPAQTNSSQQHQQPYDIPLNPYSGSDSVILPNKSSDLPH